MTTIYKLEGKPFIYSSEKPFPRLTERDYEVERFSREYLDDQIKKEQARWFSQATKTPVKEGEEALFLNYIVNHVSRLAYFETEIKLKEEGVEIDPSCFKIEDDNTPKRNGNFVSASQRKVAVFVPPVVDHANEKTTGWISVTDRLPEEKELVIVNCEYGVYPAQRHLWTNNVWLSQYVSPSLSGVTHWMPLPPPPHEKH